LRCQSQSANLRTLAGQEADNNEKCRPKKGAESAIAEGFHQAFRTVVEIRASRRISRHPASKKDSRPATQGACGFGSSVGRRDPCVQAAQEQPGVIRFATGWSTERVPR